MTVADEAIDLGAPETLDVTAALEEDIALGRLLPRERLVEDELIVRFGVKRHVVRQALVDLEAMGIVVRQPNKGAMVKDFLPKEVEDLYTVRELLECKAADLIALPVDPMLVESLLAIHRRHVEAVERADFRVVFRENLRFHNTLYASCGNQALAQAIAQFADKTHSIRSYTIGDATLLNRAWHEHAAIIEALRSGDRDLLKRLVVEHLQPAMKAYLERTRYLHKR
ncbi:GntR family transcriptional regulator [uncultured Devosia sp.]|uniref:GntR family transcriptional regulator n=1 Tax=uncultured Devosia sp. TaxID=211434 RepID=UPI0035CB640B